MTPAGFSLLCSQMQAYKPFFHLVQPHGEVVPDEEEAFGSCCQAQEEDHGANAVPW